MNIREKYDTETHDYRVGFLDCVEFLLNRMSLDAGKEMMAAVKKEVFISTKIEHEVANENRMASTGVL